MVLVTKQDFLDWKQNGVTKAFFEAAQLRVEECKEMLAVTAGNDPAQDRFFVGMIQAYRELQEFKVEDLEDDE